MEDGLSEVNVPYLHTARHMIGNEYPLVEDGHGETAVSVRSEDTREESPASSNSSLDHFEPGMVRVKGERVDVGRGAFLIAIFTVLINSW